MAATISAFPPVPLLTDSPEVFDPKAVTFNLFLANTLRPELNTLAAEAEADALSASNSATAAGNSATLSESWATQTGSTVDGTEYSAKEHASGTTVPAGSAKEWATSASEVDGGLKGSRGYAQDASNSASIAQSAVNFKGRWADLAGALNVPASVYHNGSYWQLLNDLADVTTSEPGVSADWASINASTIWTPISTSQTLDANTYYAIDFTTGPLTLTLPTSPSADDFIQFYTSAGEATDSVIARNGSTITGLAEDLTLDYDAKALHLVFNGTTWRAF